MHLRKRVHVLPRVGDLVKHLADRVSKRIFGRLGPFALHVTIQGMFTQHSPRFGQTQKVERAILAIEFNGWRNAKAAFDGHALAREKNAAAA